VSRALAAVERHPLDAYYTPDALAAKLVRLLPIGPADTVLEPHAGGGAFVRALLPVARRVHACDVNPEATGLHIDGVSTSWGADFLELNYRGADWIVGNSPFRGFEQHVEHALTLSRHVCFLLRLAVMESASSASRVTWHIRERSPARPWRARPGS
jgi:hypothetical protein